MDDKYNSKTADKERDNLKSYYKVMEVTSLLFESHIWVKKTRNVCKTEAVKTIFKKNVKCCNKISITKNE
jgi:hypothetical protein